ncbi:MAG: ATP-binding cassette domain-containing protein [Pseudoruegeria sp.]
MSETIASKVTPTVDILAAEALASSHSPIVMADRSTPRWMSAVSFIFSATAGICWIAIAILSMFFQELVAEQGNLYMSTILALLGVAPLLGLLIVDIAQSSVLAGYRYARSLSETRARGILAFIVMVALATLHPLLLLPTTAALLVGLAIFTAYRKLKRPEPAWDFSPKEAASILAGRDQVGFDLANKEFVTNTNGAAAKIIASGTAAVLSLACSTWLAAQQVLSSAATLAIVLMSIWAVSAAFQFFLDRNSRSLAEAQAKNAVHLLERPEEENESAGPRGLSVYRLTVENETAEALLKNVTLSVPPGNITGLIGGTAAGKSLLLKCLSAPFDLRELTIEGNVTFNETDLWTRSRLEANVPSVYLPASPLLLEASGLDNLTCYYSKDVNARAQRVLEQMVYSSDAADRIINSTDARKLATAEKKALGFARAFLLNPGLYLMDRPEDGAPNGLVAALAERMRTERRAGRSFVIATDNRALLDLCDQIVVMEAGRIIDVGPAAEIRDRMSEGWSRFSTECSLDSEDALHLWLRSHFRRKGDEANRRKVCIVASELLALCASHQEGSTPEKIQFDFKHFKGFCQLEIKDKAPAISNAQLVNAQTALEATGDKLNRDPLCEILRHSLNFDQRIGNIGRTISVQIQTYDPRLAAQSAKSSKPAG